MEDRMKVMAFSLKKDKNAGLIHDISYVVFYDI